MEMMVKEFFQRKEEDRNWEKKEEPESVWLAVGRNGSDKLDKSATENSTVTSLSENSKHPDFRWTWNPTWKPSNRVKH